MKTRFFNTTHIFFCCININDSPELTSDNLMGTRVFLTEVIPQNDLKGILITMHRIKIL